MSGAGYGRGGRGAALLQFLNSPVRRPGETSPTQEAQKPTTAPMGRACLLAKLQAQVKSQPSPGAVLGDNPLEPKPIPKVPMGRAAALQLQMSKVPAGRGLHTETQAKPTVQSTPSPSQIQKDVPQGPPSDDRRLTTLEYGLHQMDLNREVVSFRGKVGDTIDLKSNYIRLTSRNEGVFQYAVSYTPAVDSLGMRKRLLLEHIDKISPAKAFDGAILFLPIKLENKTFISVRPTDGTEVQVKVKLVKVVPHSGCIPVYNIVFRRIMTILQLCQVGRHFYDPHKPPNIPQHRLEVWPGYITTIAEYEGGLMLQCDVSHRVLRTETVLMHISDIVQKNRSNYKDLVTRGLIGSTVLTRYNNKTYRIDDIAWDMSPSSTFTLRKGEDISFADYYHKNYKIKIMDRQQPLLIHRPKKKDLIRMGRRPRPNGEEAEMVCLIPELAYLTGLTDEMRNDFRVMKDLATHTRVNPNQRESSLKRFTTTVNSHPEASKELEKWGLRLEPDTINLPGRKLPSEMIQMGRNKISSGPRADWSRELTSDRVLSAVSVDNWIIIYTSRDRNTAMDYIQTTMAESPRMGIQIQKPNEIQLPNDRCESYLRAIQDNLSPQVQLIVIIFPSSRDDRYNAVKKLCNVERPVPSQVIISRTIQKKGKLRSVVQKIVLQINAKLGGELWSVQIPMKKLMVVGIDVYHDGAGGSKKSIGGFVASMNDMCTRWMSKVCIQMPGQELMDGLKINFLAALREFHKVNKCLPEKIIVFRDGVGDGAMQHVSQHEISQLEDCFHHFGESYVPKFAVIVVQKRINTRIFGLEGRNGLGNPPPGTVVDHTITRKSWPDFFLVSQHVGQGTVSPTHYIIVHDSGDWQVDHLQRIAYKMTHLYYNWPGTIRVPAPCQYAHRLAYHVGQSLRKEPAMELCNRLFYL